VLTSITSSVTAFVTQGGEEITLVGRSFGLGGTVDVGGRPCVIAAGSYTHNQVLKP